MDNTNLLMDLLTTYDKNGEIKDIVLPGKSKKPNIKGVNTKTTSLENVLDEFGRLTYKPIVEKRFPMDTEEAILDMQIKKYEKMMNEINILSNILIIISSRNLLAIGYCFDKDTLEFQSEKFNDLYEINKDENKKKRVELIGTEIYNRVKEKYLKKYFELVKEYFMSIESK